MIPLMPWLAKMTQYQAHGTSLVAIIFAAFVGGGDDVNCICCWFRARHDGI